ncbi:hypothetical protein EHS14_03950 [Schaalia georgiae]|nr:hypothetical protein EHS14_03950 [Schaalia georgiae]
MSDPQNPPQAPYPGGQGGQAGGYTPAPQQPYAQAGAAQPTQGQAYPGPGQPYPGQQQAQGPYGAAPQQPQRAQTPVGHQMQTLFSPGGLTTLALELAVVVGVGLAASLIAYVSLAGILGNDASFMLIPVGIGIFTGAGATLSASGFGISLGMTIIAFPWTVIIVEAVLLRLLLNKRVWEDGTIRESVPTAVRSLVEGVLVALVTTLLTAFFTVGSSSGGLHANSFFTFLVVLLVVGLSSFTARQKAAQVSVVPQALAPMLTEVRAAARVFLPVFGALTAVVCAIFVISNEQFFLLPLILLLLPNFTIAFIGLAFFGGLSFSVGVFGMRTGVFMMAWNLANGWGALIILIGLLTIVAASMSVGVRRQRTSAPVWSRTWQLPVAVLVIMFAGLLLFNINSLGAASSFGGIGMSGWSPVVIALAAGIVSVLAEVTPKQFGTNSPGLVNLCAGRQAAATWLASPEVYVAPAANKYAQQGQQQYGQQGQFPQGGQPQQYAQPGQFPQGGQPQQYGQPGQFPQGGQPQQYGQPGQFPQGEQPQQYAQPGQFPQGEPQQYGQPGQFPQAEPQQYAQPGQYPQGEPQQYAQPGQYPQGGAASQVGSQLAASSADVAPTADIGQVGMPPESQVPPTAPTPEVPQQQYYQAPQGYGADPAQTQIPPAPESGENTDGQQR